jgi:hypothetical protein
MNDMNEMKFHSQYKNQRNLPRRRNRLRKKKMGEKKIFELSVKLSRRKSKNGREVYFQKRDQLADEILYVDNSIG